MLLVVESKKDAAEALRAITSWLSDPERCDCTDPGGVRMALDEAGQALIRFTQDRDRASDHVDSV